MTSVSVSVLMPVYNCAPYLREAIESILGQSFADYEFVVVNDGSTDESLEILKEYERRDHRLTVISQQNAGIVVALNRGLSVCSGTWIFRMDGDDVSLPNRFATQLSAVGDDPSLVLVGSACEQVDSQGRLLKISRYPSTHGDLVSALVNGGAFFPHPSACIRREVVQALGGYRERFRHAEDYDLWLRSSQLGRVGCCREVLLKLRKHRANISNLDGGRHQYLRGAAALICHLRRVRGLSDPSERSDSEWSEFVCWLEGRLVSSGYLERRLFRQRLRLIWEAARSPGSALSKMRLASEFVKEPKRFLCAAWPNQGGASILREIEKQSD